MANKQITSADEFYIVLRSNIQDILLKHWQKTHSSFKTIQPVIADAIKHTDVAYRTLSICRQHYESYDNERYEWAIKIDKELIIAAFDFKENKGINPTLRDYANYICNMYLHEHGLI